MQNGALWAKTCEMVLILTPNQFYEKVLGQGPTFSLPDFLPACAQYKHLGRIAIGPQCQALRSPASLFFNWYLYLSMHIQCREKKKAQKTQSFALIVEKRGFVFKFHWTSRKSMKLRINPES